MWCWVTSMTLILARESKIRPRPIEEKDPRFFSECVARGRWELTMGSDALHLGVLQHVSAAS